jgi:hypothetical protein
VPGGGKKPSASNGGRRNRYLLFVSIFIVRLLAVVDF